MTDTLNSKPLIGFMSGIGSGILYALKVLLTDDDVLKLIAGAGIWIGLLVALLSAYLKLVEILKKHKE